MLRALPLVSGITHSSRDEFSACVEFATERLSSSTASCSCSTSCNLQGIDHMRQTLTSESVLLLRRLQRVLFDGGVSLLNERLQLFFVHADGRRMFIG